MTIRVLVVDDSALIRELLTAVLTKENDIEVVGAAHDPIQAREMVKTLNPDVMTLDIEMPNMNGLAFLEKLMRLRPMPVVMVSTLTQKGASETLLALELGAVDFVAKPRGELAQGLDGFGADLRNKVRIAAKTNFSGQAATKPGPVISHPVTAPAGSLIAIGASTGGVEAIGNVLAGLPLQLPPIVITQHMPEGFTERFAQRLNETLKLNVCEAKDRMALENGTAYIAPGGFHMRIEKSSGFLKARLGSESEVSGHRPSVDVLFESVAKSVGPLAVGVILTGMGKDGANGLKMMRDAGARTIGQSSSSALIYGMPKAAFLNGAVETELRIEEIPNHIVTALSRKAAA